jgi:hypothetical protein
MAVTSATIVPMRIYVPSTLPSLAALLEDGELRAPVDGWAATQAFAAELGSTNDEELEYAAQSQAATASLALIAADDAAPRRRAVVAFDLDTEGAGAGAPAGLDLDVDEPGSVRLTTAVPLARLASLLVDDEAADTADHVRRAIHDLSDHRAIDDVDTHALLWFAAQELPDVVRAQSPSAG